MGVAKGSFRLWSGATLCKCLIFAEKLLCFRVKLKENKMGKRKRHVWSFMKHALFLGEMCPNPFSFPARVSLAPGQIAFSANNAAPQPSDHTSANEKEQSAAALNKLTFTLMGAAAGGVTALASISQLKNLPSCSSHATPPPPRGQRSCFSSSLSLFEKDAAAPSADGQQKTRQLLQQQQPQKSCSGDAKLV